MLEGNNPDSENSVQAKLLILHNPHHGNRLQSQSTVQITYLFLQLSKFSSLRWQKVANMAIVFSFLQKSHGSPHSGISSMNKHHDLEIKKTYIYLDTGGGFNIIHLIPD